MLRTEHPSMGVPFAARFHERQRDGLPDDLPNNLKDAQLDVAIPEIKLILRQNLRRVLFDLARFLTPVQQRRRLGASTLRVVPS